MPTIARKDGICANCGEPFHKGDPIRFASETRTMHLDAHSWSRTSHKPRHAHNCRNAAMVSAYLASVDRRRQELSNAEQYLRDTWTPEQWEGNREKWLEHVARKTAEFDAEEAHIREHGHPYPEEVAHKAAMPH